MLRARTLYPRCRCFRSAESISAKLIAFARLEWRLAELHFHSNVVAINKFERHVNDFDAWIAGWKQVCLSIWCDVLLSCTRIIHTYTERVYGKYMYRRRVKENMSCESEHLNGRVPAMRAFVSRLRGGLFFFLQHSFTAAACRAVAIVSIMYLSVLIF